MGKKPNKKGLYSTKTDKPKARKTGSVVKKRAGGAVNAKDPAAAAMQIEHLESPGRKVGPKLDKLKEKVKKIIHYRKESNRAQKPTLGKKGVLKKTNSWEEHDVKEGKKQMREGHKGHAEALFDDAHGSWNWSKSHHSTGAEHNHVVNRIAGRNNR